MTNVKQVIYTNKIAICYMYMRMWLSIRDVTCLLMISSAGLIQPNFKIQCSLHYDNIDVIERQCCDRMHMVNVHYIWMLNVPVF